MPAPYSLTRRTQSLSPSLQALLLRSDLSDEHRRVIHKKISEAMANVNATKTLEAVLAETDDAAAATVAAGVSTVQTVPSWAGAESEKALQEMGVGKVGDRLLITDITQTLYEQITGWQQQQVQQKSLLQIGQ